LFTTNKDELIMEKWNKRNSGSIYHIRIKGILNPGSFGWMEDASIINQDDNETLLAIHITDQSALRGLLEHLWNFNFTILSVENSDEET